MINHTTVVIRNLSSTRILVSESMIKKRRVKSALVDMFDGEDTQRLKECFIRIELPVSVLACIVNYQA